MDSRCQKQPLLVQPVWSAWFKKLVSQFNFLLKFDIAVDIPFAIVKFGQTQHVVELVLPGSIFLELLADEGANCAKTAVIMLQSH